MEIVVKLSTFRPKIDLDSVRSTLSFEVILLAIELLVSKSSTAATDHNLRKADRPHLLQVAVFPLQHRQVDFLQSKRKLFWSGPESTSLCRFRCLRFFQPRRLFRQSQ